eukprot:TRINITY_DN1048_c0_g3_i1.p1 TRINITY_DN1048_c0_g3~~TRINITY_DN1048_c0_g3_i1.p1  ORF type:complete len:431 (-),score=30.63 TRINITY_DN1048_c0_g3_i1:26-1318(-)
MLSSNRIEVVKRVCQSIYETKSRLAVIGAGCSSIQSWLTLFPGSSAVISELILPYSRMAGEAYSGKNKSDKFVSENVAIAYSQNALSRVLNQQFREVSYSLSELMKHENFIGVGYSAALRSSVPRRSDHHGYVTIRTPGFSETYHVTLAKEKRSREEEDEYLSTQILYLLSKALQVKETQSLKDLLDLSLMEGDQFVQIQRTEGYYLLDELLASESALRNVVCLPGTTTRVLMLPDMVFQGYIVLPGSFNPVHEGHREILEKAVESCGGVKEKVLFELAVSNADKKAIDKDEVLRRVNGILKTGHGVILSNRGLYRDKVEFLRESFFAVGADTYKRILDTKFYEHSYERLVLALGKLQEAGMKFVVAPRLNKDTGKVESVDDFKVPEVFKNMFLPLEGYRNDISSTEIRAKITTTEKETEDQPASPDKSQ